MRRLATVALLAAASCHLALGLEEATEVETSSNGAGPTACNMASQCDDDNACTNDDCIAGTCENVPVADGDAPEEMQTAGDCKRVQCTAGVQEVVTDDSDVPVDDRECTDDVCNGDMPDNPAKAAGTACASDGGIVCSGLGACVECTEDSHCTAPDKCNALGVMFECGCAPTVACANRTCGTLFDSQCMEVVFCDNDMMDGMETDVDCGGDTGLCANRCNENQMCNTDLDCGVDANMNPLVCPAGVCVPP